jgi:hypothetical protein
VLVITVNPKTSPSGSWRTYLFLLILPAGFGAKAAVIVSGANAEGTCPVVA